MKKYIILNVALLVLMLSGFACSERYTAAVKPADNHTYTAAYIEQIARDFDPDCRKFAATADNLTPG